MRDDLIKIDGSFGEGGGQIIRSSLSLSLVTGKPFIVENIRANRAKPGLMRQHLTAVNAATEISDAKVEGAALHASRLTFRPGPVKTGSYHFRIGTAGSTTLVFQTVLPALLIANGPSQITLEGGTHNPFAPPYDFLVKTFLPLVNRMGPEVKTELVRPGFFPAGGGQWTSEIKPSRQFVRFDLAERGKLVAPHVRAIVSRLPRHIPERECKTILENSGWEPSNFHVEEVQNSLGPGNAVMIELESENITALFVAFGQRGVRAEEVAGECWRAAHAYLSAGVPVDEHLADQLIIPLSLGAYLGPGGGSFRTTPLSRHATTNLEVLRRFLEVDIQVTNNEDGTCTVQIA